MKTIKEIFFYLLMGVASLVGCSCEPEAVSSYPAAVQYESGYAVPAHLTGSYTVHGGKEIVLTITDSGLWLDNVVTVAINSSVLFVNGDCWMVITLPDGSALRVSDYIAELGIVVVSVNGDVIGVFDKVKGV